MRRERSAGTDIGKQLSEPVACTEIFYLLTAQEMDGCSYT